MLRLIIAASPTNALTRFHWLKTSPAKPYFAAAQGTELTAVRVSARSGDDPLTLTIAGLATERRQMLAQYRRNSLLMSLIAILVCSALSPLVIRNGLRAITLLSRLTAATDSGTLRQPLAEQALPVELRPLGQALNTMRQKLSDDFERLNQFADDLAHELRTPVNILLGKPVMLSQNAAPKSINKPLSIILKSWRDCRD